MRENLSPGFPISMQTVLDRILFILAGNDNIHESLNEF